MSMVEFERQNLVVLVLVDDARYAKVMHVDDPEVKSSRVRINEYTGRWSVPDAQGAVQEHNIGQGRSLGAGAHRGIVGVYDRTNDSQLGAMVRMATELARS